MTDYTGLKDVYISYMTIHLINFRDSMDNN